MFGFGIRYEASRSFYLKYFTTTKEEKEKQGERRKLNTRRKGQFISMKLH